MRARKSMDFFKSRRENQKNQVPAKNSQNKSEDPSNSEGRKTFMESVPIHKEIFGMFRSLSGLAIRW